MRKRRIARAEDLVLADVDAELLAQRLLDVNFGDDAEPFLVQRLGRALDRIVEPGVQCLAEIIGHVGTMPRAERPSVDLDQATAA